MRPGYKVFKMYLKEATFQWLWSEKHRLNGLMLQEKLKLNPKAKMDDKDEVYVGDIIEELIKSVTPITEQQEDKNKEVIQ